VQREGLRDQRVLELLQEHRKPQRLYRLPVQGNDLDRHQPEPARDGDYIGYTFDYATECMGFAHYLGYRISGFQPKSDWTKYTSIASIKAEGGLQIGDILRTATHSGIVYNIGSDGTLYFAEAWGGSNNIIKINGRFAGTSSYVSLDTIPGFAYVYRCRK
jgi:hypothetical protein